MTCLIEFLNDANQVVFQCVVPIQETSLSVHECSVRGWQLPNEGNRGSLYNQPAYTFSSEFAICGTHPTTGFPKVHVEFTHAQRDRVWRVRGLRQLTALRTLQLAPLVALVNVATWPDAAHLPPSLTTLDLPPSAKSSAIERLTGRPLIDAVRAAGARSPAARARSSSPAFVNMAFTRDWCEARERAVRADLQDALDKHGLTHVNVALMGPPAAGKSSFVNSVATVLKRRVCELAQAGRGDESLTRKLGMYELDEWHGLRLFDTRGWDQDAYKQGELGLLLDGQLAPGTDLTKAVVARANKSALERERDRMHVMVFLLPWDLVSDAVTMAHVKAMREVARERDIRMVVLATHIDECDDAVADDVASVADNVAVRTILETLQGTGIPQTSLFAVCHMRSANEVEWAVGALVWRALAMIVQRAADTLDSKAQRTQAAVATESDGGAAPPVAAVTAATPLSDALRSAAPSASDAVIARWTKYLADEDLETAGAVWELSNEHFEALKKAEWCKLAAQSALDAMRMMNVK